MTSLLITMFLLLSRSLISYCSSINLLIYSCLEQQDPREIDDNGQQEGMSILLSSLCHRIFLRNHFHFHFYFLDFVLQFVFYLCFPDQHEGEAMEMQILGLPHPNQGV